MLRNDDKMWSQKSRIQWLKEGDKNTKNFHCLANGRRRMNFVGNMKINGRNLAEPNEVKEGIANFFWNHYSRAGHFRPCARNMEVKRLSDFEVLRLEEPFGKEEIMEV